LSIDSAKFYYDLYNAQQTNGGSGGSKQCTSSRYHEGWRIGGAHNSATDAATNTSPIVMTTTTPHDFVTGDVVTQTGVPGNTAANGTFTITKLSSTTYSLNGSTGNGTFPSDVNEAVYYGGGGLAWKSTSATGHLCAFASGTNEVQLYWINPDSTPADVRYLGPAWTVNSGQGWSTNPNVGVLDETDPNVPSAYNLITNGSGKQEVIRGKYMGNQASGMFRDVGPETYGGGGDNTNIWAWTSITPAPNTLSDLFAAFDPSSAGMTVSIGRMQKPGILTVSNTLGIQNSMGWLGVFNANTGTVVGLMNSWSNSNARYCGVHTPLPWEGADMYSWVPYELTGRDTGTQTNYNGPYRMLSTSGALSNIPTDCATQLTAIGKPNPLNITGNNCTTVTVSSNIPITPANYIPANDTRNNTGIQIGDTLRIYTASGGVSGVGVYDNELVKIVNFNGNTLVVQRGYGGDGIAAHATGFYLHEFCAVIPRWWDYTNAPHGSTGTDPYNQFLSGNILDVPFQSESHYFTRGGFSVSDTTTAADLATLNPPFVCPSTVYSGLSAPYAYRNYPWPNHVSAPTSAYGCVQGDPLFDGVHGNGQGDFLEKHPSPVNNFAVNPSWFDSRPYATLTDWQQTVTQLGTYIFKVTGYNHFENFDEKRNMLYVMVGHHTALDVSSPGFTLPDTTAYNYTYCLAHVANECGAGSIAGDVYVNAPYVAKVPLGWPYNPGQYRCMPKHENWSDLQLNDVCVGIQTSYADFSVQYSGVNDPYNTGARRITSALSFPRTTDNLWNAPLLPNGDWQINLSSSVNYGTRPIMFLVKVPPYPGPQRGVNRSSWIPVPLKISTVPVGTASAMVEFGYNPNLYCGTRQEVCVANTATLQTGGSVYAYETSDNPSGLPCASGCTITIPALSQRMMWHRLVYRNSAGLVISLGPVSVLATP
jgi:hypothetical protein